MSYFTYIIIHICVVVKHSYFKGVLFFYYIIYPDSLFNKYRSEYAFYCLNKLNRDIKRNYRKRRKGGEQKCGWIGKSPDKATVENKG